MENGLTKRLSQPDLRSAVERLSPSNFFSVSLRVSAPLRRPLLERRSTIDPFFSNAMLSAPNTVNPGSAPAWDKEHVFGREAEPPSVAVNATRLGPRSRDSGVGDG
jgi:hypothetical protein